VRTAICLLPARKLAHPKVHRMYEPPAFRALTSARQGAAALPKNVKLLQIIDLERTWRFRHADCTTCPELDAAR
jgi:hypothetical protein